jgi:enoyl-CoA hydratase/carnithine racemase
MASQPVGRAGENEADADHLIEAPSIQLSVIGGGIEQITLNRPEKRNALDREARRLLLEALAETAGRAKVVILTGAGGTFCAGMDLNQLAGDDAAESDQLNQSWLEVQEAIRRHPAVFIAAARGYALGGGSTLINVCDLAVVAEDAQIGMPEIGFGYYPGLAGPAAQLRLSPKRAAWMVLTAKRISGLDAVQWGMANVAAPSEQVEDEALALARHVAQFDAAALEWSKKALWQIPMQISEWRAALEFGSYVNSQIHARTDSHQAALDNFAAGRPNPGQGIGDV